MQRPLKTWSPPIRSTTETTATRSPSLCGDGHLLDGVGDDGDDLEVANRPIWTMETPMVMSMIEAV